MPTMPAAGRGAGLRARSARTGASACTSRSSGTGRSGAPPPPATSGARGRGGPLPAATPVRLRALTPTASCRPARARDRRAARPGPRRGGRDLPRRLAPPPAQAGAVSEGARERPPRFGIERVRSVQDVYLTRPLVGATYWVGSLWRRPLRRAFRTTDHFYMPASTGDLAGRTSSWAASTAFPARRWR